MNTKDISIGIEKRNKRDKLDYNSSFEKKEKTFQKSKLTVRSPLRNSKEEAKEEDMEEIKQLLINIERELAGMCEQIRDNGEEMKNLKEQVIEMQNKWEEERQDLKTQLQANENRKIRKRQNKK